MKAYSVYVYPNVPREQLGSGNPYIGRLKEALCANGLKADQPYSRNAFADFLRNGLKSDMVILNWMEDLPSRRMGLLQSVICMCYLLLLKMRGVRIIWIRHNEVSHTRRWFGIKKMIQRLLARFSDHILVHSRIGNNSHPEKTVFRFHPVNFSPDAIQRTEESEYPDIDLLIWGSMLPYKGILEFLQFVEKNEFMCERRIHIIGKCKPDYWEQLQKHVGKNIRLENKFVSDEDLAELFHRSRFILFTYNSSSVLSSGVLMDSLVAGKRMIAPDCGAFRELAAQQRFVTLFEDLSAIPGIYRRFYNDYILDHDKVSEFVARNSWYEMGAAIKTLTGLIPQSTSLLVAAD